MVRWFTMKQGAAKELTCKTTSDVRSLLQSSTTMISHENDLKAFKVMSPKTKVVVSKLPSRIPVKHYARFRLVLEWYPSLYFFFWKTPVFNAGDPSGEKVQNNRDENLWEYCTTCNCTLGSEPRHAVVQHGTNAALNSATYTFVLRR